MYSWGHAKNVLCVRLDAMGDLLMTTPAINALKKAAHGRRVTLLTSPQGAQIAKSIPLFDDIITYSAPWLKAGGTKNDPAGEFEMVEILKQRHFDASVIFTVYSQSPLPSALLCYLAKIPLRAAVCRENPYSLLTDWIKEDEPEKILRHEVRRHLDFVHHLGASGESLPLVLNRELDESSLLAKLAEGGIGGGDEWVLIHPGSTAASRRYHIRGFAETADLLIERLGKKIIFTGNEEERGLIEEIQGHMTGEALNLGGKISLEEMISLIGMSPLLISNNSGPVHMAAALGTPVVVLYALTNPQHTPWLVPHHVLYKDVPCRFCYKSLCPEGTNACLDIDPLLIFEKANLLLTNETAPCYDFQAVNTIPMTGGLHDHT